MKSHAIKNGKNMLLHSNSSFLYPPTNKQSQQSNPYKNYVCLYLSRPFRPNIKLRQRDVTGLRKDVPWRTEHLDSFSIPQKLKRRQIPVGIRGPGFITTHNFLLHILHNVDFTKKLPQRAAQPKHTGKKTIQRNNFKEIAQPIQNLVSVKK